MVHSVWGGKNVTFDNFQHLTKQALPYGPQNRLYTAGTKVLAAGGPFFILSGGLWGSAPLGNNSLQTTIVGGEQTAQSWYCMQSTTIPIFTSVASRLLKVGNRCCMVTYLEFLYHHAVLGCNPNLGWHNVLYIGRLIPMVMQGSKCMSVHPPPGAVQKCLTPLLWYPKVITGLMPGLRWA